MIVSISSNGEALLCVGDLICHPLHVEHPDWHMSHESDVAQAISTRRAVLEDASQGEILIHASHIGTGFVVSSAEGWIWQPAKAPQKLDE